MISRLWTRVHPKTVAKVGDPGSADLFDRPEVSGAVTVNERTMLTTPVVWCAINLLGNALKSLPMKLFTRTPDGGRELADHPLQRIYHRPCEFMPRGRWLQLMMIWIATRGNAYCEIVRNAFNEVVSLYPIHPVRVEVWGSGTKPYFYKVTTAGAQRDFDPADILHFRWHSQDGIVAIPPLAIMRATLGQLVTMEQYGARYFKNDARPSLIIKHPQQLSPEQRVQLRKEWKEAYGGTNAHGTALLENGVDAMTLGFNAQDSQLLELRQYMSTVEFARVYGVPTYKLKDSKQPTFNNIEHLGIEFALESVRPHAIEIEEELDLKLQTGEAYDRYYTELNLDGLLRGDIKTRFEAHRIAVEGGWKNPDEVRRVENENAMPGGQGQIYTRPANMIPAELLLQKIAAGEQIDATIDELIAAAVNRSVRRASKAIAASRAVAGTPEWQDLIEKHTRNAAESVTEELAPVLILALPELRDDPVRRMLLSEQIKRDCGVASSTRALDHGFNGDEQRAYMISVIRGALQDERNRKRIQDMAAAD